MALPTLSSRIALDTLLDEIVYTLARLQAYPPTAKYAPAFEALLGDCKKARDTEGTLREQVLKAEALVDTVDDELDDGVDQLHIALLKVTQNNRKEALYQRYFGSMSLSAVKRPILGEELERVRSWLDSLKVSTYSELQDVAKTFEGTVKNADQALTAVREARAKYTDFRQTGTRENLFRKVNAQRKSTYGELGKLAHETIFKESSDFADRFFLHERGKKRTDPETSTELKQKVEEAEANLKQAQERYEAACAQEAAIHRLKADYEAHVRTLEEAEKTAQEASKRIAELKEKIAKG